MRKSFYIAFWSWALVFLNYSIAWASPECSQVKFNNKNIVCFTKGVNKLAASERAYIVESRLAEISENMKFDPTKINFNEEDDVLNVGVDDYFIFSLKPDDFVYPEGSDYKLAAKEVVSNIQAAIVSDRESRAPESFMKGATYSLVATFVLFVVLFSLGRLFPHIYKKIAIKNKSSIRIQNWEIIKAEHITKFMLMVARTVRVVITLIAFYVYVPLVLSFFPQTANLAPRLLRYVMDPLKFMFHKLVAFLPDLFFIFIIAVITNYTLKLVRFFFDQIESGNIYFNGFHREWARPTFMLVRVLILAFAVVTAFPYIPGSSSPAFQGVSVFLGVLFSLGSTSAIANIIGGVVLTYMRPFHVNDIVKISDTVGRVIEKNLLVTRIRTIKNVEITIPNSMVLGSHMVNYSSTAQEAGLILSTTATYGYEVPWIKVHEMLKVAASKTELIEKEPAPFVLQTVLDEFYVKYELNVHTKNPDKMPFILSELHQNIQDVSCENGLELIVPHYTSVRDGSETTLPKNYRDA